MAENILLIRLKSLADVRLFCPASTPHAKIFLF
jgi:hypothetical protein